MKSKRTIILILGLIAAGFILNGSIKQASMTGLPGSGKAKLADDNTNGNTQSAGLLADDNTNGNTQSAGLLADDNTNGNTQSAGLLADDNTNGNTQSADVFAASEK